VKLKRFDGIPIERSTETFQAPRPNDSPARPSGVPKFNLKLPGT